MGASSSGWTRRLAFLALLFAAPTLSAEICTWNVNGIGDWNVPANWDNCTSGNGSPTGTPGSGDTAVIPITTPNAIVNLVESRSVGRLVLQAGEVRGNQNLTILSEWLWSGPSRLSGAGLATAVILDSAATATFSGGTKELRTRKIVNFGSITWTAGDLAIVADAEFENRGAITLATISASDLIKVSNDGAPLNRFHQVSGAGVIGLTGPGTFVMEAGLTFDNGGEFSVTSGRIRFDAGGTDFGTYSSFDGGTIEFGPPNPVVRELTGSPTLVGDGVLRKLGAGEVRITGTDSHIGPVEVLDGRLDYATGTPKQFLILTVANPGILGGADDFTIDVNLFWNGGQTDTTNVGAATLTVDPSALVIVTLDDSHPAADLVGRRLINLGTFEINAASSSTQTYFWLQDGADIDNQAQFLVTNNSLQNFGIECRTPGCARFDNRASGQLVLNDVNGIISIRAGLTAFDNAGAVQLINGCAGIDPPGVDTGIYDLGTNSSCSLAFFTPGGQERVFEPSLVLSEPGLAQLQLEGRLRVNGTARTFQRLIINNDAVLYGPAEISIAQSALWRGRIEGLASEEIRIAPAATVTAGGGPGDTPTLAGRRMTVEGELRIADATVRLDGGAVIDNQNQLDLVSTAGGSAEIACVSPSPGCGRVESNVPAAVESFSDDLPNVIRSEVQVDVTGLLAVRRGDLRLDAQYVFTSATRLELGDDIGSLARLQRLSGSLNLQGATLSGYGVILSDLVADGGSIIDPERLGEPGRITVDGDFQSDVATVYEMGLEGASPAAPGEGGMPSGTHDRLEITGDALLAGVVNIDNSATFTPDPGDRFDLFSFTSRTAGPLTLGTNPNAGFFLSEAPTRVSYTDTASVVCTWNPAGAGADVWSNPAKWDNCGSAVGPPAGTPGPNETAVVGSGLVSLDFNVTVGGLILSGGEITGDHNLLVEDEFTWTGGRMSASSNTFETRLQTGALATLAGGQKTLDDRSLVIEDSAVWTTGLIELADGGRIQIVGVLETNPGLAAESIFATGGGGAEVDNQGVIIKSGTGFSGLGSVGYRGNGAIEVNAGIFRFSASGTLDGAVTVAAGARIEFIDNDRTFEPSSSLGGAGEIVFGLPSNQIAPEGPPPQGFGGRNVVLGTLAPTGPVILNAATLVLGVDPMGLLPPVVLPELRMNDDLALLEGDAEIRVTGNLAWNGGVIRADDPARVFRLAAGASGTLGPVPLSFVPRQVVNRQFINEGSLVWIDGRPLAINDGALFENRGLWECNLSSGLFCDINTDGIDTPRLLNSATGVMRALAMTEQIIAPAFQNDGHYDLQVGRSVILGNGTDGGSYVIASGAEVLFDGSVRTLAPGGSVSGGGILVLVFGSQTTIQGALTVATVEVGESFGGGRHVDQRAGRPLPASPRGLVSQLILDSGNPVTLPNLLLQETGVLQSAFEVAISGNWTWAGGVLDVGVLPPGGRGSGIAFRLLPGATATIGDPDAVLSLRGDLRIEGLASWLGGQMGVNNAARIDVPAGGTLTLVDSASFLCTGLCSDIVMNVAGALRRQGSGTATLALSSALAVTGLLTVDAGTLQVNDSPVQLAGGGEVRVAPGANLVALDAGLVLDGGRLTGGGQVAGLVTNNAGVVAPGLVPFQISGPEGTPLPAVLSLVGGYVQAAGGSLEIDIGGFIAGSDADRLAISGTANLDGQIVLVDVGYVPVPPENYDFLTADDGVIATFQGETQPFAGYEITYGSTAVTLGPLPLPFVVNSVGDPGTGSCDLAECTLREAIDAANANPGPDTIEFAIPAGQCTGPGGACTIVPTFSLPNIDDSLHIDGYSQPGAAPSTTGPGSGQGSNAQIRIEIDGSQLSGSACLEFESGNARVSGIATFGCSAGIETQGANDDNYEIVGNFLGLRADGSVAPAGQVAGVAVRGGATRIGDGTPAGVNVIAGNSQDGIDIDSSNGLGTVEIAGNLFGTAIDGLSARPNGQHGIRVVTPNSLAVQIGGPGADQRNVIAGNAQDGIRFDCLGAETSCFGGSFVRGNFIGAASDGSALGNIGEGIHITSMDGGLLTIGGALPGEKNRIAHNGGNGVLATHDFFGRVTISVNEIFANGGIGIDLGGDGRTPNDAGDGDFGPNGLQNFPTVTAYSLAPTGDAASITVEIDTPVAAGNYPMSVDFYKAQGGEPAVWLGSTSCPTANTACVAALTFPASIILQPEDTVLAVATDANGKSSEASFYATTTVIEAGPDVPLNAQYTVAVEVSSVRPFVPVGSVNVFDDQMGTCVATLSPAGPNSATGTCELTASPPDGLRSLSGTYDPGDAAFASSEGTDSLLILGSIATTTTISSIAPSSSVVGQPYRVEVAVSDGMAAVTTGQVEVRQLSDGQTCTVDLASATACDLIGSAALATAVQVRFLGAGILEPSVSSVVPHTVNRASTVITILEDGPDPSLPGQAITVRFQVTAVAPGGGIPGGEVLITDGSASCGVSLPNLSCTFVPKATGSFTLEARYLGDANYNPSTASTSHQVIGDGADLGITKRNGLRILPAGQPSEYVILVTNAGPEAVTGARVVDLLPPELSAASWTCGGTGGGSCPASGSGNIDALVNLPVGATVTFVLTVTAQPTPEVVVTNTATVATPTGIADPVPANNSSSDTDPIGLFGDGLETESE